MARKKINETTQSEPEVYVNPVKEQINKEIAEYKSKGVSENLLRDYKKIRQNLQGCFSDDGIKNEKLIYTNPKGIPIYLRVTIEKMAFYGNTWQIFIEYYIYKNGKIKTLKFDRVTRNNCGNDIKVFENIARNLKV